MAVKCDNEMVLTESERRIMTFDVTELITNCDKFFYKKKYIYLSSIGCSC